MDYQNKKRYRKKKAAQKARDTKMKEKREQHGIEERSKRQSARLVYKYRERIPPIRNIKRGTES